MHSAQRVLDSRRSLEELHKLLPDCGKFLGHPNSCKLLNGWNSLMEKKNMILLTEEWRRKNPQPPKKVKKPTPVAIKRNSNVKKRPKVQKKGKGKAEAKAIYSQKFNKIPWRIFLDGQSYDGTSEERGRKIIMS
ncbi:hypothetical protein O181_050308 [Austropuccinia psidii MF-1]|uniref:Uncharacterized protein n=1 Tax=Austropuccinia psidii MF-1 TaxID=1389203 RepID=A0A9Q3HM88_9BASI|nr:hypothetical protein [Austropuccinia psidii MF-1]